MFEVLFWLRLKLVRVDRPRRLFREPLDENLPRPLEDPLKFRRLLTGVGEFFRLREFLGKAQFVLELTNPGTADKTSTEGSESGYSFSRALSQASATGSFDVFREV